MKSTRY